jgi:ribonuclease HI
LGKQSIVAIGGLGHQTARKSYAAWLLSICKRKRPRVCFVPTAGGDHPALDQSFRDSFADLRCELSTLHLFEREITDLASFLQAQDLVLVSGGNTLNLLAVWRAHGVDELMTKALGGGTLLAGWSAGALCWFQGGVTDAKGPELEPFRDGLGLLEGSFCPHYADAKRRERFEAGIASGALPDGYGADDGVMLHFEGGKLTEVVSTVANAAAYRVTRKDSSCKVEKLEPRVLEVDAKDTESDAAQGTRTIVYTDGACSGNPGPGGWAWAVPGGAFASGAERHTTNQRMEVTAAFRAVQAHEGPVEIVSDSTYVVNCFKQRWWQGWLKRGWINSQRKPVANRDLWEPFIGLVRERGNVTFRWVKGHSEDPMNDFVDQLAVQASQEQKGQTGRAR